MKLSYVAISSTFTNLFATSGAEIESAPFKLAVRSNDTTLNGQIIYAARNTMSSEDLSFRNANYTGIDTQFSLVVNSSAVQGGFDPAASLPGYLKWILPGNGINITSSLKINPSTGTNVGYAQVTPQDPSTAAFTVAFDQTGLLYSPGASGPTYSWFACVTSTPYMRTVLSWSFNGSDPQNPTCQKIEVVRKLQ